MFGVLHLHSPILKTFIWFVCFQGRRVTEAKAAMSATFNFQIEGLLNFDLLFKVQQLTLEAQVREHTLPLGLDKLQSVEHVHLTLLH